MFTYLYLCACFVCFRLVVAGLLASATDGLKDPPQEWCMTVEWDLNLNALMGTLKLHSSEP